MLWADNLQYHVSILNKGRTYEEQLVEYEMEQEKYRSVVIGDNNKIQNSVIAGSVSGSGGNQKKGFYEKHPIVSSLLISLLAGIILLFSFWDRIISFIEGVL